MNKKFFGRVKFLAQLILVLGILDTIPILYFSAVEYKPINFIYAVAAILGTVVLYCILKGIALIGLKVYESEVMEKPEFYSTPWNSKVEQEDMISFETPPENSSIVDNNKK